MLGPMNDGVSLEHLRQHRAGVRLHCRDCQHHRDFELEVIIEGLKARGDGDERTGIKAVAPLTHKPCPRCGGARFESLPAWPSRENPASRPPA
jgi:hypothetical protein